jgi:hypothetical protein
MNNFQKISINIVLMSIINNKQFDVTLVWDWSLPVYPN